jgi:ABC-type Fe3+/spermidine/putrescine transport system ATPase subunit
MQLLSPADVKTRVQEVLRLVGLSGFDQRDVASLSGGERQRVALARSLAPKPRLLMLDEPLGSLDAALRERLVVELRAIIKSLGLTAIYVTHDQAEAFAIADRMAVMNAGRIEQIDSPQTVYGAPSSVFVARFLGLNNIIPVLNWDGQFAHTPVGQFGLLHPAPYILLHPAGLSLAEDSASSMRLTGVVEESIFQGDAYRLRLRLADNLSLTFKSPADPSPAIGQTVIVIVPPESVIPLSS